MAKDPLIDRAPPLEVKDAWTKDEPPWRGFLTTTVAVVAICSMLAWALTGVARTMAMLGLVLGSVAVARVVSWPSLGKHEDELGGPGYTVPRSKRVQAMHLLITILYNAGIVVLVFAAMVRFGLVAFDFSPGSIRGLPMAMGAFVVMLALAARWRIAEQDGILRTWYTRVHGWILFGIALGVLGVGAWLVAFGEIISAGIPILTDPDMVVLTLLLVLAVSTQVFLSAGLPSIFDFGAAFVRLFAKDQTRRTEAEGTPPILYAMALAIGVAVIVGFVFVRFDIIGQLGDFRNERVALLLALLPVFLAIFFISSALQILKESRRGFYKKKIPTKLRNDLLVYGTSALLGIFFTTLLAMNVLGKLEGLGPFPADRTLSKDLIMAAVVTGFGPIGIYMHRQNRRVDNVEMRLPDFLNDLAETRRAGLTLTAALQSTALADYGALTPEIRKMADQVAWGIPFTEALRQFAQRVPTNLVRRTVYLIIEASKTGGSVAEILKAAAKDAYELKGLESERRVTMSTYLIVLYVVFGVFVTVIAVLDAKFIPEVLAANEAAVQAGGESLGSGNLDRSTMNFVYYNAAIVQSIGNGLVGGVLSEARVTAGFRHVTYMALMAWIVFRLVLGA